MLKLKEHNYINLLFFTYLFSYIAGPAIINIYVTILSLLCLFYLIFKFSFCFKKVNFQKSLIIFLIFYFYLLIKEVVSSNFNIEIIVFLRFVIIFLFLSLYLQKKSIDHNFNFKLLSFIILFLSLDTIFQYLFNFNLLGFEKFQHDRLTGIFNDEPIIGSFLFKILIIYSVYIFLKKNKNFFSYFIIFICSIAIFLSGERMPFLQLLFGFAIILFIIKPNLKIISLLSFAIIFLLFVIFNNFSNIKSRYLSTINGFITLYHDIKLQKTEFELRSQDGIHDYYLNFGSGIQLWKNNLIFGNGYRYYKNNCFNDLKNKFKKGCSTHPHNIYIELLTDHGILGLFLFILFIINLYYEFVKNNYHIYYKGFLLTSFIISFPIVTSQSIFSSYYGSLYFLFIFMIRILSIKKIF